ncbi:hypothetical protein HMI54_007328 [Coelomomyces lativittatus]|nr:hypothetical protein HMI54_007328 [Coelomomyces lativittatus]
MGICFSRSKKKTKNKTNGELSGAPTPLATTNDKPPLESHAHTTDAQISLARNIPFINDASAIPASVESEKQYRLPFN